MWREEEHLRDPNGLRQTDERKKAPKIYPTRHPQKSKKYEVNDAKILSMINSLYNFTGVIIVHIKFARLHTYTDIKLYITAF